MSQGPHVHFGDLVASVGQTYTRSMYEMRGDLIASIGAPDPRVCAYCATPRLPDRVTCSQCGAPLPALPAAGEISVELAPVDEIEQMTAFQWRHPVPDWSRERLGVVMSFYRLDWPGAGGTMVYQIPRSGFLRYFAITGPPALVRVDLRVNAALILVDTPVVRLPIGVVLPPLLLQNQVMLAQLEIDAVEGRPLGSIVIHRHVSPVPLDRRDWPEGWIS